MSDTLQGQASSNQGEDLTRRIPFETAVKLLEALYIRAEAGVGAREDLDKVKELLLS